MEEITSPVELIIKASNQKIKDQTYLCDLDWNVQRLKKFLFDVYPTKPKEDEQKLIYSGRLLHNHLKLKDFLRHESGQVHTLHLVCITRSSTENSDRMNTEEITSTGSDNRNNQLPSDTRNEISIDTITPLQSDQPSEGIRLRFTTQQPSVTSLSNSQAFPQLLQVTQPLPQFPVSPELMAQQMAAFQQIYAQYLAQYMQYAQSNGTLISNQPTLPQASLPTSVENNVANEHAAAPQRPGNENFRINAQGGQIIEDDEEEEVGNRDWLDWFYVLSRALVLLSIVYFYSSPGRFMIVTGIAVLAYLYQAGWLAIRRQENERRAQESRQGPRNGDNPSGRDQQNEQQAEQANGDPREMENIMDGDLPLHGEQIINDQVRNSPFVTAWTVITSFFSSLIPEQPAPLNVN